MANLLIAGRLGTAAILEMIFFFRLSDNVLFTNFPNPSIDFRKMFPVNPSVTTMSTLPEKASLPSTLPIKLTFTSPHFYFNN